MRVILTTNTNKTSVKKADGKYQISGIPVTVDNAIMNGFKYTAEENAKGMKTLNGMPMALTHPADEDGRNVSIFSPDGIDFYSGGKVTSTYNKDGVWYADSEIDEKRLKATEQGEYFANRLDNGLPIGVSTGLTFEANNKSGDGYKMEAINQSYDHLAMLHDSERPAGGDSTVMRFNGEDVSVINIDDIEKPKPTGPENELIIQDNFIDKVANKLKALFANDNQNSYNNTDLNTNHEAPIMDRTEMLEALGLATNSQVTDDELKTLMKSKLAANASEGFSKEDVVEIVNSAIKPLADQLTANAEQELDSIAEQVEALKMGINKDSAKAMGLDAAKSFLAANSAEYVASGYVAPQKRASQTNSEDDGVYRSSKPFAS
ncbi:MAG: hypothetical protein Unbinned6437contig1000_79 [Prokaryotic dsDNA virus sp.]|nr:MAG: hypothetical protein Unbinned6437contig1000_79 [Prokaryotic dsDNA virus sp.]|tara:strand:- start:2047 stop:3174 length:1128 start_codon:yes stop_codon:yes gene_type:complete